MYTPHVLADGRKSEIQGDDQRPDHPQHPSAAQPAGRQYPWNKSQPPGAPPIETSWKAEEVAIPVKCNIHPWMHGYFVVVKGPVRDHGREGFVHHQERAARELHRDRVAGRIRNPDREGDGGRGQARNRRLHIQGQVRKWSESSSTQEFLTALLSTPRKSGRELSVLSEPWADGTGEHNGNGNRSILFAGHAEEASRSCCKRAFRKSRIVFLTRSESEAKTMGKEFGAYRRRLRGRSRRHDDREWWRQRCFFPGSGRYLRWGSARPHCSDLPVRAREPVPAAPSRTSRTRRTPTSDQKASEDAAFFREVFKEGRSLIVVRTESQEIATAACAVLDRSGLGMARTDPGQDANGDPPGGRSDRSGHQRKNHAGRGKRHAPRDCSRSGGKGKQEDRAEPGRRFTTSTVRVSANWSRPTPPFEPRVAN